MINRIMRRHILPYSQFIFEQDMGMPMPDETMQPQAAPVKAKPYTFLFMDDADKSNIKKNRFPDGSYEIIYPSFSVLPDDLDEWVESNIVAMGKGKAGDSEVDLRRQNLIDIVSGKKVNISNHDVPFIEKLKNAVTTRIFGKRDPDVSVTYTKDGTATTNDIDITFIKYKS